MPQASKTSTNGSGVSTASKRYTSAGSSAASSFTSTTGQHIATTTRGTSNTPLRVQSPYSCSSTFLPAVYRSRILFGLQSYRWSLELEQIEVSAQLNDPAFFRELKTKYRQHRGRLKLLLSPFRFRFCRFVKFEKFDANRILSKGEDLPDLSGLTNTDYDYDPRPGKIPLIDPNTFAVCLRACDESCIWPWFNPWHDCITIPQRFDRLRCIPKKKSDFDLSSDNIGVFAWGIQVDHALSFAFLAVYHLVPIFAAFGFWIYWLVNHPGDWQNAAVPIMTVLAVFVVFWMPFGKQNRII